MAKKDTSDSSRQSSTPKVRKSRKASVEAPPPVVQLEVSPESFAHIPSDADIARKAYALWEGRGRPMGSPDEDWYRAQQELTRNVKTNGAHA